jgi:hypothetical protein
LRNNYKLSTELAAQHSIPIADLMNIKGFDDGFECYMIYKIMDEYRFAMKPKATTVDLVTDLFTDVESLSGRDPVFCTLHTYMRLLKSRNYSGEERDRIWLWMKYVQHVQNNTTSLLELTREGEFKLYR